MTIDTIDLEGIGAIARVYEIHDQGHRIFGFSPDFRFEFEAELMDRPFARGLRRGRLARLDVVKTGTSWSTPISQFCGRWTQLPPDDVRPFVAALVAGIAENTPT